MSCREFEKVSGWQNCLPIVLILVLFSAGSCVNRNASANSKKGAKPPLQPAHWLRETPFKSAKGRPIDVYVFGSGKPSVLVVGGIHGDERPAAEMGELLLAHLKLIGASRFRNRVVVIPVANPDGVAAGTRGNSRGVDINRNFPTKDFVTGCSGRYHGGRKPLSEPETRAIFDTVCRYHPALILTFHAPLGKIVYNGPSVDVAKRMAKRNKFPIQQGVPYPTPGALGAYYGYERRLPVVTLELRASDNQWKRHGRAVLEAVGVIGDSSGATLGKK